MYVTTQCWAPCHSWPYPCRVKGRGPRTDLCGTPRHSGCGRASPAASCETKSSFQRELREMFCFELPPPPVAAAHCFEVSVSGCVTMTLHVDAKMSSSVREEPGGGERCSCSVGQTETADVSFPRLAVSGDDVSVPRCSLQPLVLMGVCVDLLLTCSRCSL